MARGRASDARAGEFELIERYLAPLASEPGSLGLVDDAATLTPPEGCDLVLTKDALAAGIHFFTSDPADAIAKKALRVNLSDLAAKGARPLGYLLGLGLAPDWSEAWVARFCRGLAEDQSAYAFALYGGDTIKVAEGPVLSITAIGALPRGGVIRRSTARTGDALYVTGSIGDAALGLALRLDPARRDSWGLDSRQCAHLLQRYLLPQPRTAAAQAVRLHARACMDISDGLVADLAKMLTTSGVGADIDVDAIAFSEAARQAIRDEAGLTTALTGGDDYELLASVAPGQTAAFEKALATVGVASTRIGTVTDNAGSARYTRAGTDFDPGARAGFVHF